MPDAWLKICYSICNLLWEQQGEPMSTIISQLSTMYVGLGVRGYLQWHWQAGAVGDICATSGETSRTASAQWNQFAGETRTTDEFRKIMVEFLAQNNIRFWWPSNSRSSWCWSHAPTRSAYNSTTQTGWCYARCIIQTTLQGNSNSDREDWCWTQQP